MKLTRRDLIKLGAGAGVASLSAGWTPLMAGETAITKTTIPSTGQQIPCVGIGTVKFRGDPGSGANAGLAGRRGHRHAERV